MVKTQEQGSVVPLEEYRGKTYAIRDLSYAMAMYAANCLSGDAANMATIFYIIKDDADFILRFFDEIEFLPDIKAFDEASGQTRVAVTA